MKCSLLLALAFRAQFGQGFVGPTGGLVLSNCVSVAARSNNNIVRRGVASTSLKAAASDKGNDVSGCYAHGSFHWAMLLTFLAYHVASVPLRNSRNDWHTTAKNVGF